MPAVALVRAAGEARVLVRLEERLSVCLAQGRFMLAFASTLDALRFCHAAQSNLLFSQWPPEAQEVSGAVETAPDGRLIFRGPRVAMAIHEAHDWRCAGCGCPAGGCAHGRAGARTRPALLGDSLRLISGQRLFAFFLARGGPGAAQASLDSSLFACRPSVGGFGCWRCICWGPNFLFCMSNRTTVSNWFSNELVGPPLHLWNGRTA
jgi:hypothetical protein